MFEEELKELKKIIDDNDNSLNEESLELIKLNGYDEDYPPKKPPKVGNIDSEYDVEEIEW